MSLESEVSNEFLRYTDNSCTCGGEYRTESSSDRVIRTIKTSTMESVVSW
jgi:hypothetical protein